MPDANSRFLYFIGGSKGGVGKSILSMILADFLTQCRHRKIILVESDTATCRTCPICHNIPASFLLKYN